jgi:pyridoxal 5'-phosphate synthase pdxS subunit
VSDAAPEHGRLPVVTFTAGDPAKRAEAIVAATTHFRDRDMVARVSEGLGEPMVGIAATSLGADELLQTRGW